jgi:hypothetical protein
MSIVESLPVLYVARNFPREICNESRLARYQGL